MLFSVLVILLRSSHQEVFLRKAALKICSKFTGEHPCRIVISVKMLCNFIEITLWHVCSPVNLLHIFRIRFPRNTSWWLLLSFALNILKKFSMFQFWDSKVSKCIVTIPPKYVTGIVSSLSVNVAFFDFRLFSLIFLICLFSVFLNVFYFCEITN